MNRPNKTELAIFISLIWPLLPKDLINQNLFVCLIYICSVKTFYVTIYLLLFYCLFCYAFMFDVVVGL